MQDDPEATIVGRHRLRDVPAAPARRRAPTGLVAAASVAGVVAVVVAGFEVAHLPSRSRTGPAAPASVAVASSTAPALSAPQPRAENLAPLLGEVAILSGRDDRAVAARFQDNPAILVIDFPNLTAQGQAFNRLAAFIEKRDLARDRLLTDQELADAIRADAATVETYYYGHDYRAADVQRFFAKADEQDLPLSDAERDLRALLAREGLLTVGVNAAVISIPREGGDPFVDASGRISLLRHELSHGEYFTNPAYADYVRRFWSTRMTEADRAAFRRFLSQQGYDAGNEDLIANETQAHLMHTTDRRYFNAAACGLPAVRIEALRAEFLMGMPAGWLKDAAAQVRSRLPS